jgi:hypothetical protein
VIFFFRDKYEQFKAKWAEQSAWSNIALRESAVNKRREQELLLLRKAHIIVCFRTCDISAQTAPTFLV